jgi:recombinational DNA repair protein RecT
MLKRMTQKEWVQNQKNARKMRNASKQPKILAKWVDGVKVSLLLVNGEEKVVYMTQEEYKTMDQKYHYTYRLSEGACFKKEFKDEKRHE